MQVLIQHENFATDNYDLQLREIALVFKGKDDTFDLPCSELRYFSIIQDRREKTYFTALCCGKMYEGRIIDCNKIEKFTSELKDKLHGVININVRK